MEQQKAVDIMTERGYGMVSHNETKGEITKVNFTKGIPSIKSWIHATVELKPERVTLAFVDLKLSCSLFLGPFAMSHQQFHEFEGTLVGYAAACLQINPLALIREAAGEVKEVVKKTVEERKKEWMTKVVTTAKAKGYTPEMTKDFFYHWTQMNDGGKKMKFEMEKIFDIPGRLRTWKKNQDTNFGRGKSFDKKVEEQKENKTVKKVLSHKQAFG